MSEFIHKAKIAALKQSNSELIDEVSNLKTELHDLNAEIACLRGENPDDIKHLKEKVTEYEQREAEFKERILTIYNEAKNNKQKPAVVKQLLSALQVMDSAMVENAIEQHYKKKGVPKIIVAFLSGVLVSLGAWLITNYLENDKFYRTFIKRILDNI